MDIQIGTRTNHKSVYKLLTFMIYAGNLFTLHRQSFHLSRLSIDEIGISNLYVRSIRFKMRSQDMFILNCNNLVIKGLTRSEDE